MNPSVAQALAALPEGLEPESGSTARVPASDELLRLAEDLPRACVPEGRFRRGWILGSLSARIAAGYFAAWIRGALVPAEERAKTLEEAHLRAALRCLGTMTHLRGAVMKVGQLLANWPTLVPEEFADTLSVLHFEAPPMHSSLVSEVIRSQLGADPETVFARFDSRPFAAASLGQVHAARLHGGEEVAVKVQYPGIARAIRSDLTNLSLALLPLRLKRDGEILREQLDDVAVTLERETDYEQEARFQEHARSALAGCPEIVVPRVHRELSTRRVLTMERLDGRHLSEYLAAGPSQEDRDTCGRQLLQVAFHLYYRARFCYADPHPGNFLFLPDGRLGLLDFGCCRVFDDEEWALLGLMEEAFHRGGAAWERGLLESTRSGSGVALTPAQERAIRSLADWQWEPLRHAGAFDFGSPDYFPRGVLALRDLLRSRATRSAPVFTWVQRSFVGLRALASRLGARVDVRALHERMSAGAFRPATM